MAEGPSSVSYKTEEAPRGCDNSLQPYEMTAMKKSNHLSSVANKNRRSNNWLSLLPLWVKWLNPLLQISQLVFYRGERATEHGYCVPKNSGCRGPTAYKPWAELPHRDSSMAYTWREENFVFPLTSLLATHI